MQLGPIPPSAGGCFLEHLFAAGVFERANLRRSFLTFGLGDARVAERPWLSLFLLPNIDYLARELSKMQAVDLASSHGRAPRRCATEGAAMKKHEILSLQSRAAPFDPPTEPTTIVRHYTYSVEDLALIRQRRRAANRLGFALHLAYLRFPCRALGAEEAPPAEMLAYIASQVGCDPVEFVAYARRDETRREHLGEFYAYLDVRPFQRR